MLTFIASSASFRFAFSMGSVVCFTSSCGQNSQNVPPTVYHFYKLKLSLLILTPKKIKKPKPENTAQE